MQYNKKTQEQLKQLIFAGKVGEFITAFNTILQTDHNSAKQYLNGEHDEGRALLGWAAMQKNAGELIKYLIATGADVNHQDGKDRTALSDAVAKGNVSNAKILILNGADISLSDFAGNTPLHIAAEPVENSTQSIELLFTAGASVTATNNQGATPVHMAAKYNFEALHAMVRLRKEAIDINRPDNNGDTPLHYAAISETGHNDTYLLMLGADSTIINNEGKTAAQVADDLDSEGKDWEAIIGFDPEGNNNSEDYYVQVMADEQAFYD